MRVLTCYLAATIALTHAFQAFPSSRATAPSSRAPTRSTTPPSSRTAAFATATPQTPQALLAEKRETLKQELFEACAAFKEQERASAEAAAAEAAAGERPSRARRFFRRLRGARGEQPSLDKKLGKQLSAESFVAMESSYDAALREKRDAVVAAVDALAPLNPTAAPLDGWRGRNGRDTCALDGRWALRFTNAADATFKRDDARGAATTSQTIDSAAGLFVNCVDFDGDGKLRGFRVEVEGEALNDSEVQLVFKRVRLLRRSRFPRLFGTITIPLPNPRRLRKFSRGLIGKKVDASDRGAGFALLYVDDDVRMHRTFDGLLFVQQRLADGEAE